MKDRNQQNRHSGPHAISLNSIFIQLGPETLSFHSVRARNIQFSFSFHSVRTSNIQLKFSFGTRGQSVKIQFWRCCLGGWKLPCLYIRLQEHEPCRWRGGGRAPSSQGRYVTSGVRTVAPSCRQRTRRRGGRHSKIGDPACF